MPPDAFGQMSQRRQTEDHTGYRREEQREAKHRRIDSNVGDAGNTLRIGDRQGAHAGPGDDEAKSAAKHEEHEPFGDELSEQPPPARTEGPANGDLATTNLGADHQEVGEIRASDEQYQPHATGRAGGWR